MNLLNSKASVFGACATAALLPLFAGAQLNSLSTTAASHPAYRNERVNQDQSKYPKSVAGVALDPTTSLNIVVSENDKRLNNEFSHDFFHVTRDGGIYWKSDIDSYTYSYLTDGKSPSQLSRGIAFDSTGHSYTALYVDPGNESPNNSAVVVSVGLNHGSYVDYSPIILDERICSYDKAVNNSNDSCYETLDTQGVAVDNSATASNGTIYVYYNLICNSDTPGCESESVSDGAIVTLVTKSPGFGKPFQGAGLWSRPSSDPNTVPNTTRSGASTMVVDSHGTPYLFFADVTNSPKIDLWQSTNGNAMKAPFVEFLDGGLNNPKWKFREDKQFQCAEHNGTGYCAFAANQVGSATAATTPSIFLAAINLADGKAKLTRVNNDSFTGGKDHFNPSVAVAPDGDIYVGWFDDRRDPSNLKVDYFVGKSTDGGKTFPNQHAINDVSFDPTIGVVGPSGAMVVTAQNSVKAFWADTRDGATQQIWSEEVK